MILSAQNSGGADDYDTAHESLGMPLQARLLLSLADEWKLRKHCVV
jgi:hypothetical protein